MTRVQERAYEEAIRLRSMLARSMLGQQAAREHLLLGATHVWQQDLELGRLGKTRADHPLVPRCRPRLTGRALVAPGGRLVHTCPRQPVPRALLLACACSPVPALEPGPRGGLLLGAPGPADGAKGIAGD